jgi:hypothetical protein
MTARRKKTVKDFSSGARYFLVSVIGMVSATNLFTPHTSSIITFGASMVILGLKAWDVAQGKPVDK